VEHRAGGDHVAGAAAGAGELNGLVEAAAAQAATVVPRCAAGSDAVSERDEYDGACPACGSRRWVGVSLNGGWTRIPQCVPCGAYHRHTLGPGWRAEQERRGREIRDEKRRAGLL
jgi:DNA-directed RNA polymerase subunit RPC12/RpoP